MDRDSWEWVDLPHDGIEHETDEAILFKSDADRFLIPKSLIDDWDAGMVSVPVWFAEKEGLV